MPPDEQRATLQNVYDRLESRLDRIEDRIVARLEALETDVRANRSRLDKIEGGMLFVRWLGPAGVGAVLLGLLALAAGR